MKNLATKLTPITSKFNLLDISMDNWEHILFRTLLSYLILFFLYNYLQPIEDWHDSWILILVSVFISFANQPENWETSLVYGFLIGFLIFSSKKKGKNLFDQIKYTFQGMIISALTFEIIRNIYWNGSLKDININPNYLYSAGFALLVLTYTSCSSPEIIYNTPLDNSLLLPLSENVFLDSKNM